MDSTRINQPGELLTVLHEYQSRYGCIDENMRLEIQKKYGFDAMQTASVQSFYSFFKDAPQGKNVIRLCTGAPCHLAKSNNVIKAFEKALNINVGGTTADGMYTLETCGCIGACSIAPAALINDKLYGPIDIEDVSGFLSDVADGIIPPYDNGKCISLEKYKSEGGYEALNIAKEKPENIISELSASGLRGRSGSGFPVGLKWTTTLNAQAKEKYIICNADEGEPETMKDRSILSYNPHKVIEGMCIAAAAVGAVEGIIYLRYEYSSLASGITKALSEARIAGILGAHFDIQLVLGAGAYICGEETGLIESLEGNRPIPRLKPPFPGEKGIFQMPTIINNVETLADVPEIILHGAEVFRSSGTEKCPGVKKMSISGCVNTPGVYAIPLGSTVRDILDKYAGGCVEGKRLYAIQTGGGSGTIVTPEFLAASFDIEGAAAAGGFFGAGDLMFISDDVDIIELLINEISFFIEESCGKCVPCRVGLTYVKKLLCQLNSTEIVDDVCYKLSELCAQIKETARCAFGAAAVTPVISAMSNFPEVFQKSVKGGTAS